MGSLLNSLSRFLSGTRAIKSFSNRRNGARHAAVANRGRISWWVGEECFDVPCQIKDISLLGASVLADGRPPANHPLWIRLEEPCQTDWIEVTSVRDSKSNEIGVIFPENCPYDLFKKMVPGCLMNEPERKHHLKEFDTRYWR